MKEQHSTTAESQPCIGAESMLCLNGNTFINEGLQVVMVQKNLHFPMQPRSDSRSNCIDVFSLEKWLCII